MKQTRGISGKRIEAPIKVSEVALTSSGACSAAREVMQGPCHTQSELIFRHHAHA